MSYNCCYYHYPHSICHITHPNYRYRHISKEKKQTDNYQTKLNHQTLLHYHYHYYWCYHYHCLYHCRYYHHQNYCKKMSIQNQSCTCYRKQGNLLKKTIKVLHNTKLCLYQYRLIQNVFVSHYDVLEFDLHFDIHFQKLFVLF